MDLFIFLDLAKYAPILAILAYASGTDLKTHSAPNKLWLYAPIGAAITYTEYAVFAPGLIPYAAASLTVTAALALVFFYMRHGWGGADAKAVITLAACCPLAPVTAMFYPMFPGAAVAIGASASVMYAAFKRRKQVPFIPFLLLGFIAALFA